MQMVSMNINANSTMIISDSVSAKNGVTRNMYNPGITQSGIDSFSQVFVINAMPS